MTKELVMDGQTKEKFTTKDLVKAGSVVTLAAFMASCSPDITAKTPTPLTPQTPESGPTVQSPETQVTKGVLSEVTNKTDHDEIVSSLPADRPEAKGGNEAIETFKISAGGENFKFAIYELTPEEIAKQPIIEITDANGEKTDIVQSVALYAQNTGYDGKVSWSRLVAITIPQGDKTSVAWVYDQSGFPVLGSNKPVDLSRPVLGYFEPMDVNSALSFSPLTAEPSQIVKFNIPSPLTVTASGEVPAALKIEANIKPTGNIGEPVSAVSTATPEVVPKETFEPMELSTDPEKPGKCAYEDITSGRLAYWERQNAKPFAEGAANVGWINKEGGSTSDLILSPKSVDAMQLTSICTISGDFEGLPNKNLHVIGVQVLNIDGTTNFLHFLTDKDPRLMMNLSKFLEYLSQSKKIAIIRSVDSRSVDKYWNDPQHANWYFRLYRTEGEDKVRVMVNTLQIKGVIPDEMEKLLFLANPPR